MDATPTQRPLLGFVCAVSDPDIAAKQLLASPDLDAYDPPLHLVLGAENAARAFNAIAAQHGQTPWLVWVHQDVYLPEGWISSFERSLRIAQARWPNLAVVGVYGTTPEHQHAGVVIDRGEHLIGEASLPCPALGLDELLVAVRLSSGLRMDPELGWDFYASDLALQAKASGFQAAVVHAPCEHWSTTPRRGISDALALRFEAAGCVYLRKWQAMVRTYGAVSTPSIRMADEADLRKAIGIAREPIAMQGDVSTRSPDRRDRERRSSPALMVEACWLDSAGSLEASDDECQSALSRLYRECGISRFWHLAAHTTAAQRGALPRAWMHRWLLVLPIKPVLIAGSFVALIQAWERDTSLKPPPRLSRALSAHELGRVPGYPTPDYATGAGFERFSERLKKLALSPLRAWPEGCTRAWPGEPVKSCSDELPSRAYDEVLNDEARASQTPGIADVKAAYWLMQRDDECAKAWLASLAGLGHADQCGPNRSGDGSIYPGAFQIQDLAWPFCHRFDDYRLAQRSEMLCFVPQDCQRLLDWGGGEGGFAALAQGARPGLEAWVADIDALALDKASQKGLKVLDATKPMPAGLWGHFDLVAMLESLEHVENPADLLRQARSLLKPGGRMLLSVPHIGFAPVLQDLAMGRFEYEAVGPLCTTHRRFYSATGLRRLLDALHFEIIDWRDWPVASAESSRIEAFHVLASVRG